MRCSNINPYFLLFLIARETNAGEMESMTASKREDVKDETKTIKKAMKTTVIYKNSTMSERANVNRAKQ